MMDYVSLHTHSTFSTGDGYGSVRQHVDRVVDLGGSALAFTEHGNPSSWVQLEKACAAKGIKAIFGIEAYVAPVGELSKCHMILLAMNDVGLQNLNRIITKSWQQFYKYPTVHWKDLVEWNEGIIALSGCADSELSCILLGGKHFGEKTLERKERNVQRAVRGVERFKKVFGDRYYLEVQRFPGLPRTCVLNPILAEISTRTGVPLVATCDVHYCNPEDNAMQRILHASHRGGTVETADASWEYDILLTYPTSDKEIDLDLEETFGDHPQADMLAINAVLETKRIAERCNVTLPKAPLPTFGVDNPANLLRDWITEGWKFRVETNVVMQQRISEYKKRMKHEYETICAREGFADYFLIVADLVLWAKNQGIAVGPGRGSSAGSLVCYLLQITEIDSMQFPMLFERFLDPSRTDPPDIDIDFEDDRLDEVFDYATTKYGKDRVAKIGTFTRYRGRSSLDDIARVYRIPSWKIDAIKGKLIDRAEGHPRFFKTLEDTFNTFSEVKDIVEQNPELRYAARLEGNIRQFGIHPAGMVISSRPLSDTTATLQRDIDGRLLETIAFDKYDCAYLGLLKIDALSLQTMSTIAKTCALAGISLQDLYRVPLNDEKTLEMFRKGEVLGIFQFEGPTTRRILKQVQPTTFMHLSDVNALSRPGANDKMYISNKQNRTTKVSFAHPIIEKYTTEWPDTNGVIVYEEQILYILRDLGGFEPVELNRMRKIIHDKLGSTAFNEYYQRFLKGCAAHGLSEEVSRSIWDGMVSASGYAFNIAHSVSYAHIGYWAAWLKSHFQAEFTTGQLQKCSDNVRRGKLIQEVQRYGISVEPPNLLLSGHNWTYYKSPEGVQSILAGLQSMEGIGPKTCEAIINWRIQEEAFAGVDDFFPEWDDLIEVKGIGAKTISKIKKFCESPDPFGVNEVGRILDNVREAFNRGELAGIPTPTHVSVDVPTEREFVCFMGIVRKRKFYDAVEQLQKRTATELSYEDALLELDDPHLLKYVALEVEDEYGEVIKVRISRWKYPALAKDVQNLKMNRDVIVAQGYSSDFGGVSIQVKQMVVIDPYG